MDKRVFVFAVVFMLVVFVTGCVTETTEKQLTQDELEEEALKALEKELEEALAGLNDSEIEEELLA
jgi:PBP1b-binding outer membrane lipoprotein LpoB